MLYINFCFFKGDTHGVQRVKLGSVVRMKVQEYVEE